MSKEYVSPLTALRKSRDGDVWLCANGEPFTVSKRTRHGFGYFLDSQGYPVSALDELRVKLRRAEGTADEVDNSHNPTPK